MTLEASTSPFPDNHKNHWAYLAVYKIQRAGITFGPRLVGSNGLPAMTRHDFAVSTARLIKLLPDNIVITSAQLSTSLNNPLYTRSATDVETIDNIKMMVDAFGPELASLGVNVPMVKRKLDYLEASAAYSIEARMHLRAFSRQMTIQNGTIPDLIMNRWVYQNVDQLHAEGIDLSCSYRECNGRQDITYESISTSVMDLLQRSKTTDPELREKLIHTPGATDFLTELMSCLHWSVNEPIATIRANQASLREYQEKAIALEDADYQEHVRLAGPAANISSQTFDDTPINHWAYVDLAKLQKSGIAIVGNYDFVNDASLNLTRHELAVHIAKLLPLLQFDVPYNWPGDEQAAAKADLEGKLDASPEALDALEDLVDGFKLDLRTLGCDVTVAQDRLLELRQRTARLEAQGHLGAVTIIGPAHLPSPPLRSAR